jgi:Ca-activated chloride channel family protein
MKKFFKAIQLHMLGLALAVGLAACQKVDNADDGAAAVDSSKPVFTILAGSELKDIEPIVKAFGESKGVAVKFDYSGSLDAIDKLSEANNYDAAWVSHGKYLQLIPQVQSQIKASEKTMYSRVVFGVKPEKMRELGWKSGKTTWQDIVAASKAGKFHFAMTNPSGSNTGFVALVGLATELSGKGDALTESDIPAGKLKELFAGQSMTSGSSGVLAEQFLANPQGADGMVNYESIIKTVSQKVPLEVLIPKEGVITADYPLMLLAKSKQQPFYAQLVEHLRSESTQKQIAQSTFRTPLAGDGSDEVVNELPFPGSVKVVDAILRGFLDEYSRPASSFFVLDVSDSMQGERLADMKRSMAALAQGDGSVSGRFSTFRNREKVYITSFSNDVQPAKLFAMSTDTAANQASLAQVASTVNSLHTDGGTAIYDALKSVYATAQAELKAGGRSVSIVLFTDGENNSGIGPREFLALVDQQGSPRVPIHTILYGEGNSGEMNALASATGGKTFDARTVSLKKVMKTIRAFQ